MRLDKTTVLAVLLPVLGGFNCRSSPPLPRVDLVQYCASATEEHPLGCSTELLMSRIRALGRLASEGGGGCLRIYVVGSGESGGISAQAPADQFCTPERWPSGSRTRAIARWLQHAHAELVAPANHSTARRVAPGSSVLFLIAQELAFPIQQPVSRLALPIQTPLDMVYLVDTSTSTGSQAFERADLIRAFDYFSTRHLAPTSTFLLLLVAEENTPSTLLEFIVPSGPIELRVAAAFGARARLRELEYPQGGSDILGGLAYARDWLAQRPHPVLGILASDLLQRDGRFDLTRHPIPAERFVRHAHERGVETGPRGSWSTCGYLRALETNQSPPTISERQELVAGYRDLEFPDAPLQVHGSCSTLFATSPLAEVAP